MSTDTIAQTAPAAAAIEDLIACPHCDALYLAQMPQHGGRAICTFCHTVLIAPRRKAGKKMIALTLSVMILVVAALFFPFLDINASGFGNSTSILDAASSFRSGYMVFLSFLVASAIIFVPLLRTVLILYVLVPVVRDRPALPHARRAFRWSQELKPWAMAEIFAIGCAVALVKVQSLAHIGFGPAFWMFAVLVILVLINDNYLCTWSVWKSLELEED
ncbi:MULTISPECIES: paraquat-inducible protein A [Roseobacteraceae]|jgi:paraquat-inducible protein A|uniref:Paraquat-inducible protein A n=1 Tax=Pseudosulfitobacter pseudonitzschiae TaxID=1402135 RepID=A0A221JYB0_9RHOB|nr:MULTISPECIES: paraquat-inducible protein A [Roseobacteraceae]ASM71732.1 paraquat-inducible protein A [Pseudosulfitobacter pseudonitzschiae]